VLTPQVGSSGFVLLGEITLKSNSFFASKIELRTATLFLNVRPADLRVGFERRTEMANTVSQRQFLALKLDALTESEVQEVLDYIAIMESMRRSRTAPSIWEDEVLAVLADARENQRARQAFEWETVRRKAERRAAAKPNAQI
jgi:hypothetical protein